MQKIPRTIARVLASQAACDDVLEPNDAFARGDLFARLARAGFFARDVLVFFTRIAASSTRW
jgi:hypothetical protein